MIPSNYNIIGTCSICGGPVGVPKFWWGVTPEAFCLRCGATKDDDFGPTIPMKPVKPSPWRDDWTHGKSLNHFH